MQPVQKIGAVEGKGLQADRGFGRISRHVLLVDLKQLNYLELEPGDLRENITVDGLAIDCLPVGTKLIAGDVILEIVNICHPCNKLEKIRPGLMEASRGIRGMLANIESGGSIREGALISIMEETS